MRRVLVAALILLCMFLPFLPGRYDGMAAALSLMAQVMGMAGLLLVPAGALWLAFDRPVFRILAAAALIFVWAFVAIAALVQNGFALSVLVLAAGIFAAKRVWRRITPLDLIVVPILVALVQFTLIERAVVFSRNTAIHNSAPLIAAIEHYRQTNGQYPETLFAVNPDLWPGVVGISIYHYERHGDAYNLYFEQFSNRLGNREIVVYNPRDEHVMTSHSIDILQLTPEQLALERTRGHYALLDAPSPHWKYYWFD